MQRLQVRLLASGLGSNDGTQQSVANIGRQVIPVAAEESRQKAPGDVCSFLLHGTMFNMRFWDMYVAYSEASEWHALGSEARESRLFLS